MSAPHIIVMGVSGCGKSTIGRLLSERLGRPFVEGDAFHSGDNISKMAAGSPLTDRDRRDWIAALCETANAGLPSVIACSALNATVRNWLETGMERPIQYVHLILSEGDARSRLEKRDDHFMPPDLIRSQFAALDPPDQAVHVDAMQSPAAIVEQILSRLS